MPAFRALTREPQDRVILGQRPALYKPDPAAFVQQSKRAVLEDIVKLDNLSPQAREVVIDDMTVFSLPVLRLLREDGLRIVGVGPGQNLADSGWYDPPSPERYQAMLD